MTINDAILKKFDLFIVINSSLIFDLIIKNCFLRSLLKNNKSLYLILIRIINIIMMNVDFIFYEKMLF